MFGWLKGKKAKQYWVLEAPTGGFEKQVDGDGVPGEQVTDKVLQGMRQNQNFTIEVLRTLAARYYFINEADCDAFLALCSKTTGNAKKALDKPKATPAAIPVVHDDEAAIAKIQVKQPVLDADFDAFLDEILAPQNKPPESLTGPAKAIGIFKKTEDHKQRIVIAEVQIKAGETVRYASQDDIERVSKGEIALAFRRIYRDEAHAKSMFDAIRQGSKTPK